jgi:chromosome segregation ATPase
MLIKYMYSIHANRTTMGRFQRKRKPKMQSESRQNSIIKARVSLASIRSEEINGRHHRQKEAELKDVVKALQESVEHHKSKAKAENTKYWNERRRNQRLKKADQAQKANLKRMMKEGYHLRGALETVRKEMKELEVTTDQTTQILQERVKRLEKAKKEVIQDRSKLRKRCQQLATTLKSLKKRAADLKAAKSPTMFKMTQKGVYTRQARVLARFMVSTGTSEAKVGATLQKIGQILGIKIDRKMNKRTVQRAVLEAGSAADIQLAYEMANASSKCL